jgi:HD-GYP domain-containing protein (c-di-GMP phosphodiesterase class II)
VGSDRIVKIPVSQLRIGMCVVDLDRPWLETPFLVQGFVVKSLQELELLNELCRHVYVDTELSKTFHKPGLNRTQSRGALTKDKLEKILNVRITPHADSAPLAQEMEVARGVYADYETMVSRFYRDLKYERRIDLQAVRNSMGTVVDSVIRNPDAFMLLTRLKRKSDYAYNHAIGCSVWAAAVGRQLGLPKHVMISVAAGALLLDVGKISISDRLLNKPGKYSLDERALMKMHVSHGIELLERAKGVDNTAAEMMLTHHERHNGKGYPKGLKGNEIPVFGRIAGIVDCYDALVNDRPYRSVMAPSEAIRTLYNVRNIDFQSELVEAFIQALGVYPAGSLVELNSGEVAIVVGEHRHRRLRPRVALLLDRDKRPLEQRKEIDLNAANPESEDFPTEIVRSINPGEYGLNLENLLL